MSRRLLTLEEMTGLYDTLSAWARKTTLFEAADSKLQGAGELIYRLRQWPQLPAAQVSADVLRTLSVMSHRPVNRRWILSSSSLSETQVDALLSGLIAQGVVDVTDPSGFKPR